MVGIVIIGLLIASVIGLSGGFLMIALRMGKNFNSMSQDSPPGQPPRRRSGPGR